MNLNEKEASKHKRVLVFGAPKTGKTQLVGDLAADYKLEWFDFENGFETLLKLPSHIKDNINLHSFPDTRSFPIAIETMLKLVKGGTKSFCEAHGKVDCPRCKIDKLPFSTINFDTIPDDTIIVIDSLTQLTNSAMSHITKGEADDYKLTFNDYGSLGKLMDIILSHIQQAKYNVVCISHETEAEMEDDKKKIVPVAGTRNFSRSTAKYFDHVIYADIMNKKHRFGSATDYSNSIVTGSRTNVRIEDMAKASLLSIFKPSEGTKEVAPVEKNTLQENTQGAQALSNIQEKLAALKAAKEGAK